MLDDFIHRAWLAPPSQLNERLLETGLISPDSGRLPAALMNLFSWIGPEVDCAKLIDYGIAPWWTSDGLAQSFWRPLAALTHWVDYHLWPESAALMHAHSLLWFGAAILVVTLLFRQLIEPAWIAGLAALLYTLDENYYFPVAWIANRNVLLSLFFAILALLAHHRWRRHNSRVSAALSPFCLLLSLLSAEAGIATVAYLAAYALFLDRGSWAQRALSLIPSAIVAGGWRLTYNFLGYGAYGSGLYVDPGREPLRFAAAVLEGGPILLWGQWGGPPPEAYNYLSELGQILSWISALVFLSTILIILLPLLRKDRVARFWGTGMLLSVVPSCSMGFTMGRLLFFVGLGAMGLSAQFIGGLFEKQEWLPNSRVWRIAGWGLCLILITLHMVVTVPSRFIVPSVVSFFYANAESNLQVDTDPGIANQDLIIVNAPSPFDFIYFSLLRAEQAAPLPRATRILAPGFTPFEIVRTGEETILIRAKSGNLLSPATSSQMVLWHRVYAYRRCNDIFFRAERFSRQESERILLTGLVIEVSRVGEDGLPREVSFQFAVPLEDPSLRWLKWDWQTASYVPFSLPAVGESVQIAGPF
jgi:hypothetical protein